MSSWISITKDRSNTTEVESLINEIKSEIGFHKKLRKKARVRNLRNYEPIGPTDFFQNQWPETLLENVIELRGRIGFHGLGSKDYTDKGPILLAAVNISNDKKLDLTLTTSITEKAYQRSPEIMIQEGDVIFTTTGTIGKACLIPKIKERLTINPNMNLIRPGKLLLSKYILYWLLSSKIQNSLFELSPGSAQKALYQRDIRRLRIPIPPKDVQKKIITKLEHVLEQLVEKKNIILELQKTKSKHSEFLSDNFMSFLIAKLIPVENYPSNWKPRTLVETFDDVNAKWKPNSESEDLNYIGLENIESNTGKLVNFVPTNSFKIRSIKTYFSKNDVLYGKLRPYLNKVFLPTFDGICSTDILVFRPKPEISKEFLSFLLRSSHVVSKMTRLMYGTRMPRVKIQDLHDIKIGLPLRSEQKGIIKKLQNSEKIVDSVSQSFKRISTQQRALTKYLKELQSSVLDKAFSGKFGN